MANIAREELNSAEKLTISSKDDGSPFTEKDLVCERKMRELLTKKVPEHAIWGEEFGRKDGNYQWVLDPIDGSIGFISGSPLYSTLIGLVVAGKPALGVIEMPALAKRWYGIAGHTCYRDERLLGPVPCRGTTITDLNEATISITLPPASDAVRNLLTSCAHVRYGGDAFNFGCVADGTLDLAVEEGLKPYDWLACVALLEAAGACVTDFAGNPPSFDCKGNIVAAGNPVLHAAALGALTSKP